MLWTKEMLGGAMSHFCLQWAQSEAKNCATCFLREPTLLPSDFLL